MIHCYFDTAQLKNEVSDRLNRIGLNSIRFVNSLDDADVVWTSVQHANFDSYSDFRKKGGLVLGVVPDGVKLENLSLSSFDGLIRWPISEIELVNWLKNYKELKNWRALLKVDADRIAKTLENANRLLKQIQKEWSPNRFSSLKGFKVFAKHLSGLRPGGDFFDVFESPNKDSLNLLLSDSSSYSISSAFLGALLSSGSKLSSEFNQSPSLWLQAIIKELTKSLGNEGEFSVFYGSINRKDLVLNYQKIGRVHAYIVRDEKNLISLDGIDEPFPKNTVFQERHVQLHPKDRLVLLSQGLMTAVGNPKDVEKIFLESIDDGFKVVDELVFSAKRKKDRNDDFQTEDCTAIVIDVDMRLLRIAG